MYDDEDLGLWSTEIAEYGYPIRYDPKSDLTALSLFASRFIAATGDPQKRVIEKAPNDE